jgi:glutamate-1-semialdehyde aminotransferase
VAVVEGPDRRRIRQLTERERARFLDERPINAAMLERAARSMPLGVPMAWMASLHGHPPLYMDRGEGAHLVDVDGHRYLDMNIADTSMFCGYGPEPLARAVSERIRLGAQFLMPSEDAIAVAEELGRRWPLPKWQFTLSATLSNVEAIRFSRFVTGRPMIVTFDGKYHGHADELLVAVEDGRSVPENPGLPPGIETRVRVVTFNDVDGLARALEARDVACVLIEPALTNVGIVMPDEGFHEAVRAITRETGTVLVIDETHTLICGPAGLVGRWGLEPDIVTLGKSIGGGVAIGAYGMTEEISERLHAIDEYQGPGAGEEEVATGGTLFGNPLQMAAARAVLEEVLTEDAYERSARLGARLADGIEAGAASAGLPWKAHRLFPRSGYAFTGEPARNGAEARAMHDGELWRLLRLWMANRGVWEAMEWAGPAVSVAATDADVEHYLTVLGGLTAELVA